MKKIKLTQAIVFISIATALLAVILQGSTVVTCPPDDPPKGDDITGIFIITQDQITSEVGTSTEINGNDIYNSLLLSEI
ncbi:MAG: hypothetical protein ACTSP4_15120 [Candidatus Hodarchaeales archaeon]